DSSVVAVRVFSISAGLEASTVTPGSTPPDASRTVPVRVACANTVAGSKRSTSNVKLLSAVRIESVFLLVVENGGRGPASAHGLWHTQTRGLHTRGEEGYAPNI